MVFKFVKALKEWLEKRNSGDKMEKLILTIAEIEAIISSQEEALSTTARRHLKKAEEEYQTALSQFKDDYEECLRRTEFGLFRLELVKQQLAINHAQSSVPNFPDDSAQYSALELSKAITETKIALEFSNCVVSEENNSTLIAAVKYFNNAVDLIHNGKAEDAKRLCRAGLLWLYLLKCEIEYDNKESIINLSCHQLASPEMAKLTLVLDRIFELKQNCSDQGVNLARINSILDTAQDNFYTTVAAFASDNQIELSRLLETLDWQIKMIQKLIVTSTSKLEPAGLVNQDSRLTTLQVKVIMLQRLINHRAQNSELARKRLDAALDFYTHSLSCYEKGMTEGLERDNRLAKLEQAEKDAAAACIDLDFCKHLLFSTEKTRLPPD